MKPETKEKLDKIVPLLAHWMEDGMFFQGSRTKPCRAEWIPVSDLVLVPERFTIVPRLEQDLSDLDADHHLPEPSKQATDYMKTV